MALRTPLFLGNPAVQHPAENDRLGILGALLAPEGPSVSGATSRPLTVRSGALQGPPGTMGEVTLVSNTVFTINPARWFIQSTTSALGGVYEVINDAVSPNLPVPPQHATQYRRSYVGVWVADSFVAGSGGDAPAWGTQDGPFAASNPQLPAANLLPANFLALGELLVPPVGQAVTWTPYDTRTTLRGQRLRMATEAAITALPATRVWEGLEAYAEDTEATAVHDGTRWLFYDTKWQTYTPRVSTTSPTNYMTNGNATMVGRYYRMGRQITLQVAVQLGTTTAFVGSYGTVFVSPPPGYAHVVVPGQTFGYQPVVGAGEASGGMGFRALFCAANNTAVATDRRLFLINATGVAMNATAGNDPNISAVNHYFGFTVTYETAFEA